MEENASISKALSRLSEVEEKIHELHDKQVSDKLSCPNVMLLMTGQQGCICIWGDSERPC